MSVREWLKGLIRLNSRRIVLVRLTAEDRARILQLGNFYGSADRTRIVLGALKTYMNWSFGNLPTLYVSRSDRGFEPEEWDMPALSGDETDSDRTMQMLFSEGLYGAVVDLMGNEGIEDDGEVVRNALAFLEKVAFQDPDPLYCLNDDGEYTRFRLVLE